MTLEYRVGDVFDRLAEIPDGSIDLIVTSPPFLGLRSYLPEEHADKAREIGTEPTPAAFIDTMLALSAEWRRVLAPHGSLCVELGDTYSGSGGAGGDGKVFRGGERQRDKKGTGWPLAKSMCLIPHAYTMSLAYDRNILTGCPSPAGDWRIRNVICWARPNPPVGALGDKFRPATSYITMACVGQSRYFDLDAVRLPNSPKTIVHSTDGAPPLDWHADEHPEDGDWLWKLGTAPYKGSTTYDEWVPTDLQEIEAEGVPADDIRRTASPDCPRHGGLPGQVPSVLRDARAGSRSSRTGDTDDHREQGQLFADDASGSSDEHSVTPRRSSDSPHPSRESAATRHSSQTRRTGHVLATSQPCKPSAQTMSSTGDTPASPEWSARDHDSAESSTSLGDSLASLDTQTSADTADTPRHEQPCTCSYRRRKTQSTSHFATYPFALPKRLIEAMCPLRVCRTCGAPSERITERTAGYAAARSQVGDFKADRTRASGLNGTTQYVNGEHIECAQNVTTGWTDCGHDDWRPGIVLDPFAGSGTTLEAAQAVGRHAVGIDIDERNADLARDRVGMFLDVSYPLVPATPEATP